MKKHLILVLLSLLGLLCACSRGTDHGRPVAAALAGSPALANPAQRPLFVLYEDGSLIFRRNEGGRENYKILQLDEDEQNEVLALAQNVVGDPALKDFYDFAGEDIATSTTAYIFFSNEKRQVVQVNGLAAIEVASLRLGQAPDFSRDEDFPNALIHYITTLGMLRIAEADDWKPANSDPRAAFPGQERWNDVSLKFSIAKAVAPLLDTPPAVVNGYPAANPLERQRQPKVDTPDLRGELPRPEVNKPETVSP